MEARHDGRSVGAGASQRASERCLDRMECVRNRKIDRAEGQTGGRGLAMYGRSPLSLATASRTALTRSSCVSAVRIPAEAVLGPWIGRATC